MLSKKTFLSPKGSKPGTLLESKANPGTFLGPKQVFEMPVGGVDPATIADNLPRATATNPDMEFDGKLAKYGLPPQNLA